MLTAGAIAATPACHAARPRQSAHRRRLPSSGLKVDLHARLDAPFDAAEPLPRLRVAGSAAGTSRQGALSRRASVMTRCPPERCSPMDWNSTESPL